MNSNNTLKNYPKTPDKDYKMAKIFFKIMKCYMNPEITDYYFELKKALFDNEKSYFRVMHCGDCTHVLAALWITAEMPQI